FPLCLACAAGQSAFPAPRRGSGKKRPLRTFAGSPQTALLPTRPCARSPSATALDGAEDHARSADFTLSSSLSYGGQSWWHPPPRRGVGREIPVSACAPGLGRVVRSSGQTPHGFRHAR